MESIYIKIEETDQCEGGYIYTIYESEDDLVNCGDGLDGGHCISTIANALEMAYHQARELLKNK